MPAYQIETPLTGETVRKLRIGDAVQLSGTIYVARDAAHKRFMALLERGEPLPVDLRNQVVFYAGPTPAKPGRVIGSIAPTTASRMDPYTPPMLAYGVKGTIGKGPRGDIVKQACGQYEAVCFAAVGGLSALLSQHVQASAVVAYEDLGPEAVRRLEVAHFPLLVVYDCLGQDLYEQEIAKYRGIGR